MTTTVNVNRKTVAEVLAEQAESLVPVDGDKAYTVYYGFIWEGVLKKTEWNDRRWGGGWVIVPTEGKKVFDHAEGQHKYFKNMEVANICVYDPDSRQIDKEDSWHKSNQQMGYETPNKMVAYDVKREMFYLRTYEDDI